MSALDAVPGDAQAVIDSTIDGMVPNVVDPEKVYDRVIPAGATHKVIDLEQFLPAPRRKRGKVSLSTVESFIAYAKEHLEAGGTTVWVHPTSGQVVAVLNDHQASEAAWGDHRAELALVQTDEWKRWLSRDGQLLDQETFAEHIEDSQLDIVNPDGAELLEIAQTFHATTTSVFRSSKRLASGAVQLTYAEDIEAKAGANEDLEVPAAFELAIKPFVGEEPVVITARLRHRTSGGHLKIGYKLDRPADIIRDAIERITDQLRGEFADVYVGTPRS